MLFVLLILPFFIFVCSLLDFIDGNNLAAARQFIASLAACIPALLYVYLSGAA